jgi:hypothetical protein
MLTLFALYYGIQLPFIPSHSMYMLAVADALLDLSPNLGMLL